MDFFDKDRKISPSPQAGLRVASIDVLRAITMVLMIFVNDLWSLTNIPSWLEHVESGVDGIGLADVVFPAFLFIVGMSVPLSLQARQKKGDNTRQLAWHVILRAVALLVMGVFLVNGEEINEGATGLPRLAYNVLCCTSFILIWNAYPKKKFTWLAAALGILILTALAVIYRGGENASYFSPKWWGILGLIGWAYGASALVAVFAKNNFVVILGAWILFCVLSILSHAHIMPHVPMIPGAIMGGTLTAITLGGILTSLIFQHYIRQNNPVKMTSALGGFAILLILLSLITRPYWGLSKLGATPAWLFLCSAFTILAFIAIYWLVDQKGKASWFNFIKPAGTDTLLCYLIPYYSYAFVTFSGIRWPELMLTGGTGLIKAFVFALLCAWITGRLNKFGIRLKL